MTVVLDASALIAMLKGERGATTLRQLKKRGASLAETLLTIKDAIRRKILTCVALIIERVV